MPKVSVLMPVFNSASYVIDALESVRQQSFPDFELIVVNDGSTDNSSQLVRALCAREPRIRYTERQNQGLVATRNQLLSEARCEYVAWMDSDDLAAPDRLERQLHAFEQNSALVCVGTNVRLIDPDGFSLGEECYPTNDAEIREVQRLRGGGFHFPSTMQPRSVAIAAGGFREPFRIGEDLDFLLRIAEHGILANVPQTLYSYRQHLLSTCVSLGSQWPAYRAAILELALERRTTGSDKLQRGEWITMPPQRSGDVRRYMPAVLLDWADRALGQQDRRRAIRYMLKAIRLAPESFSAWRRLMRLLLLPVT